MTAARSLSGRMQLLLVLTVAVVALSLIPSAHAFGAGNIPAFSYLEGKAFRHGDIEDVLAELAKKMGHGFMGIGGGSKFGGLDIKRVYFGNWLRDYSQAMDVAALKKMPAQSILNIVMVLGFLAHGYATGNFEATFERLGVYLPTEHIDNPKGYAEGEDARKYDKRLRGPVDPRELEIDTRSGMKAYIAMEGQGWDTSSALVRRTLKKCIDLGREARKSGNSDTLYEAYRLLGTALHTMEDFPAHSNWCELALVRLGHRNVFTHVGANVRIRSPEGIECAPLVTGTFGGADFMHSLLGETADKLSSASVSDLSKAVDDASQKSRDGNGGSSSAMENLFSLLSGIPGASDGNTSRDAEELSRGPSQDPANMSPQEIYKNLFAILKFRDDIMMKIEVTIEKIPGLSSLVEKITNSLTVFVMKLIEPYMKPLTQSAMSGLHATSSAVVSGEDQTEVFTNPNCSDPTHSMLSKDHFGLILNEVAGNVARIIVKHVVQLVVKGWDGNDDAELLSDEALAVFYHPFWYNQSRGHPVQREMLDYIADWARGNPEFITRLDAAHVRAHSATRSGKVEAHTHGDQPEGQQGYQEGSALASKVQGFVASKIPQTGFIGQINSLINDPGPGGRREIDNNDQRPSHHQQSSGGYESQQGGYGGGQSSYPPPEPQRQHHQQSSYGDSGYQGGHHVEGGPGGFNVGHGPSSGSGGFGSGAPADWQVQDQSGFNAPPPQQQYGYGQQQNQYGQPPQQGYDGNKNNNNNSGYGGQQGGYGGQQGGYGGGY